MTEIHVSKSGDNSNPGTLDAPKRTIGAGAAALRSNDTLLIHGGVYVEDTVEVATSGVTVSPFNNEEVIIDGQAGVTSINSGFPSGPLGPWQSTSGKRFVWGRLLYLTGDDITVNDLIIRRSMGRGVQIGNGKRRPKGVTLNNVRTEVTRADGIQGYSVDDLKIINCSVIEAADLIAGTDTAKNHSGGLTIRNSKNTTIQGCKVHRCWGEGLMIDINFGESSDWLIENCEISDCGWLNLYVHATQNGVIRDCHVFQSADFNPNGDNRIGAGIGLHINPIEPHSLSKGGEVITNNILVENTRVDNANLVLGWGAAGQLDKVRIIDSAFRNYRGSAIIVSDPLKNSIFENNIIMADEPIKNTSQYKSMSRGKNTFNKAPGGAALAPTDTVDPDVKFPDDDKPPPPPPPDDRIAISGFMVIEDGKYKIEFEAVE